jgi:FixJ family two-component response regulator
MDIVDKVGVETLAEEEALQRVVRATTNRIRPQPADRRSLNDVNRMERQCETVALVDSEPRVLRILSRLMCKAGYQVSVFASVHEFLGDHDPPAPGCIVLDVCMPGSSGLELQSALEASGDLRPIVFISGSADIFTSVQAMKRGAVDFLAKPIHEEALLAAVHCAMEKGRERRKICAELQCIAAHLVSLTPRELEVFHQIVAGRRNKQIAGSLGTVEKTIKVHRSNLMKKMGAKSLPELVRMAVRMEGLGEALSAGAAKSANPAAMAARWRRRIDEIRICTTGTDGHQRLGPAIIDLECRTFELLGSGASCGTVATTRSPSVRGVSTKGLPRRILASG